MGETLSCREVVLCQLAGTARVRGTVHVARLSSGLIVISAISITEQRTAVLNAGGMLK